MELTITEKNNAARRIADILSDGEAVTVSDYDVAVYEWDDSRCIGLSGHVVAVDFPEEYNDWRDVEPVELIEAPVQKRVTRPDIVSTLKGLVRDADRVVIATDYDREGELIGKEAYEIVRDVDDAVPVDRVRFSSITDREVRDAFDERDEIDFDLAAAGEARQIIDLVWGAALTRFLSLSAGRLGDDFISVGRVQSPTLKLIVDREREIDAFEPDPYWEITTALRTNGNSFEAQYFYLDEDDNEAERIWDEETADVVFADLQRTDAALVASVDERTRTDRPPAPFNTTQFIRAAGAIGYGAQRAMSIAEDLYTAGYITYPRTDNTVYPTDLDPRELVEALRGAPGVGEDATELLESDDLTPTRGDEETTDHPPIHPTAEFPDRSDLSNAEWDIYELVVRRFYATLAEPAIWKHLKVVAIVGDHRVKANGRRLVQEGYHRFYPYFSTDENVLPPIEEDARLAIDAVDRDAKETQPPRRYGQSRLIEKMESLGVGTKCLTGDTDVLVRGSNGLQRRPVASLYEDRYTVLADGDTDIALQPTPVEVLSLDETSGRIGSRSSPLMSRRELRPDEDVYRIETDRGTFSVTGDHPLYVARDGGFAVLPARAVTTDSRLVATPKSDVGRPSNATIESVERRSYDGPVFDLTVEEAAPNFAVADGVIVHNSTRHHTIEKLYDRGYIEDDPPRPTQLARAVVEAGEEFAELVTSEEMTAQLEADMTAIATGEAELADVTEESRQILERVFQDLMDSTDDIGELIRESLRADRTVGPCPDCGEDLLLRRSRRGSRFIGCDGYPDCEYTLPLPNGGEPLLLEDVCEDHDLREVKMLAGRNTFVHGCPQCRAEDAEDEEDVLIGACPECGDETGGELAIKRLRSGSRLVGCTRYPDCEYSLPLPRRGEIAVEDRRCEEHGLPELTVHSGDEPWELGCPICNYQEYLSEQNGEGELENLEGVGAKTAEKLADAGIDSIADLLAAEPESVAAEVDGISENRIRQWQAEA